jgi:hypothetical protein
MQAMLVKVACEETCQYTLHIRLPDAAYQHTIVQALQVTHLPPVATVPIKKDASGNPQSHIRVITGFGRVLARSVCSGCACQDTQRSDVTWVR